jgi:hypothetical protein
VVAWGALVTLEILGLINLAVAVAVAVEGLTGLVVAAVPLAVLAAGRRVPEAPAELVYATAPEDLAIQVTPVILGRLPTLVAVPFLEVFLVAPVALAARVALAILAVLEAAAVMAALQMLLPTVVLAVQRMVLVAQEP